MKFTFLNRKQTKPILALLEKQWGFTEALEYAFLMNEKDDVFIVNKEIGEIAFDQFKLNSLGLYIGQMAHGQMRLSIEGSQLIGPKATKGVVDVDPSQVRLWLRGSPLEIPCEEKGFVIIRCKNDYFGSGKPKEGRILNYVPKIRRLQSKD